MRFLVAHPGPAFSVQDVFTGWVEALRELGQHVNEFNLADRLTFYDAALIKSPDGLRKAFTAEKAIEVATNGLYAALYKTRPDVLLAVSAFFYPTELMRLARAYGTRVVVLHTESPYEDGRQLMVAAHADLNLINDPTNLGMFEAVAPTRYIPHSYRPAVHHPGPADPQLAADLAFVGTGFESRIRFFESMDLSGLDVLLAGQWTQLSGDSPLRKFLAHEPDECLDNHETAAVYRSARVGLNLYRREAETPQLGAGWAMGPREVELAACGAFFLRDPRGEGDELLTMLPTFEGPEDAADQVRFWLNHPTKRHKLATQAREAIADRTFTNRAAELLALLNEKEI